MVGSTSRHMPVSILGSINSMADMDRCNEKSGCWTIPPMGNSWLRRTSNGVTSFHVVAVSVDAMVVVDCWHGGVLLECIALKALGQVGWYQRGGGWVEMMGLESSSDSVLWAGLG